MSPLRLNPKGIPAELRERSQWVLWRLVHRLDGTTTKIPVRPDGHGADTTNPMDWSTFQRCLRSLETHPDRFDGVGFVFSASDPYVGIDLDKVRNPETDETESWAQDVILELDSYSELSQSGTGVHIIVKGELNPNGGNRRGRMEMYSHSRFFVMTGRALPSVSPNIQERHVHDLQRRMVAGLDPKPPEPSASKRVGSRPHDESAIDFGVIAGLVRKLGIRDASVIESEIARRYPDRYKRRRDDKGDRCGQSYWRYSVERTLNRLQPAENPNG